MNERHELNFLNEITKRSLNQPLKVNIEVRRIQLHIYFVYQSFIILLSHFENVLILIFLNFIIASGTEIITYVNNVGNDTTNMVYFSPAKIHFRTNVCATQIAAGLYHSGFTIIFLN